MEKKPKSRTPAPWEGDHGFSGSALLAWERQRLAQRQLLDHAAWRTDEDPVVRGEYVMLVVARRACPCPMSFGPGGKREGARWVNIFPGWPVEPVSLNGASLDRASLYGASLDRASLYGASLYGASLNGASLVGASLDRALLNGASLDRASLDRASLNWASLDRASLYGASLVGASLNGASLDRASLNGASLYGADLRELRGLATARWEGATIRDCIGTPDLSPYGYIIGEGGIVRKKA